MAWTDPDVARSIRRYLISPPPENPPDPEDEPYPIDGSLLSPPWRARIERREVLDDERPVLVVQLGQRGIIRARASLEQGEVESLLPVTVYAYPVMDEDEDERAHSVAAQALKAQLLALIANGKTVQDGDGRDFAAPFRIPLWDYDGVPLEGPDRAGPDDPHDVLVVLAESLTSDAIQDEDDLRRFTVVLEMRVTVEAPGRVKPRTTWDADDPLGPTEDTEESGGYIPP